MLLSIVVSILMVLAIMPGSAGAIVEEVSGTKVGLEPHSTGVGTSGSTEATFANESGNAVVHGSSVYAVYWDPNNKFHHEWETNTNYFLQQLGEASGGLGTIFSSLAQYRDRTNRPATNSIVFKGAYHDFAPYPSAGCTDPEPLKSGELACITDAQLRAQLQSFITVHELPKGMNTIYYVITPPGLTVCLDAAATHCSDYKVSPSEETAEERHSTSWENSFCSYHGDINPDAAAQGDGNTILYAAIPWIAGDEGGGSGYEYKAKVYSRGFDCQDGGWSPLNSEGKEGLFLEHAKEMSKEEEEKFAKETAEEQAKQLRTRELEGPHLQEPNQTESKNEGPDRSSGLSDVIVNQIAVQQADIATDPLLDGWQDSNHNEVTDECRDIYGNTAGVGLSGSEIAVEETEAGTISNETVGAGRYYINNTWSGAEDHCAGGVGLIPRFTAPDPVDAGETVAFDGMESTVGLLQGWAFGASGPPTKTYATFTWNFGDGSPEVSGYAPGSPPCEAPWLSPCAASELHSYQYAGTYKVALKVTDVAGDVDVIEHEVTVHGLERPGSGGSGGSPRLGQQPRVSVHRHYYNVRVLRILGHGVFHLRPCSSSGDRRANHLNLTALCPAQWSTGSLLSQRAGRRAL